MSTIESPPTAPVVAEPEAPSPPDRPRSTVPSWARELGRWAAALGGSFLVFGLFIALRGEDPVEAARAILDSAVGDWNAVGETLVRATPILLAALAVVVPARAGLFNIGGEGQLVLGAIGATGMSQLLDGAVPTAVTLVLMALAAMALGALWSGIAAVLRLWFSTNEAITTLLLNYLATLILTWLVFVPWKDPASLGQAYSEELDGRSRFGILWGNRVHVGVIVALVAAVAVWLLLTRTRWGFRLRVLGGNPEAARRAGFAVGALTTSAMVVGGALAGLGGMVEVAGVEARLRPEILAGFGFTAFLASWLARHHPLKAIAASMLLGGIVVGGFGLKIATGLSGGAVDVLTALVLLGVLGYAQKKETV
ncbi:MAG: ABC transporter permease [Actinomycetota bacterium]|nr:ABC transporter permease [Actinomycetota bacterium]